MSLAQWPDISHPLAWAAVDNRALFRAGRVGTGGEGKSPEGSDGTSVGGRGSPAHPSLTLSGQARGRGRVGQLSSAPGCVRWVPRVGLSLPTVCGHWGWGHIPKRWLQEGSRIPSSTGPHPSRRVSVFMKVLCAPL